MAFRMDRTGCVLTLGLALGIATPACAADAGGAIPATAAPSPGEIVVTAQRRAQSVMDVPLAISALGGDTLTTK
ncbi:hypothetical protein, partial [Streptomyces scabiei]|uniref:hypothetical protein n=1 Tax=Streptomyces scabiei TaxID=1930 RepID=UPI0038F75ACA